MDAEVDRYGKDRRVSFVRLFPLDLFINMKLHIGDRCLIVAK